MTTFSVFDETSPLATAGEKVREKLAELSETVQLDGCEVTVIVTKLEADQTLSHAVLSTIDDHEELLNTLDHVVEDCLEPYEDDDDDQLDLGFEKVTLQ